MALRRRSRHREDESFPGFTEVVRIGAGGFSTVFSAREIETNRPVALKILNVHDVSEHALGSFQRETYALGTLSAHPNIVTLYRTLTTEDDRPVLVLELCNGSIWERTRDQGRLAPWESVAVTVKIAGALETAHRAGMLHRDIKPENVLITQYGEPALADFGVARLQSTSQATAGVFGFTTIHAAPELLEGRDLSAATDVYGLASTLYQLLVGKAAFRSFEDEGPASVILRILRDPVQPPVAEGIPVALSDLLVSSMSKNPYDRPASALELADELRSIEAATGWPDTAYAIEEATVLEHRAPSRAGRFQVRGVDAPVPASVDVEPERPAPPVAPLQAAARLDVPAAQPPPQQQPVRPEPAARPEVPAAVSDPAEPPAEPVEPVAAEVEPIEPVSSPYAPDPTSETVFMRTGPGRVEVPRGERHVLTPQGYPAPVAPEPIRPLSPMPAPVPRPAPPAQPTPPPAAEAPPAPVAPPLPVRPAPPPPAAPPPPPPPPPAPSPAPAPPPPLPLSPVLPPPPRRNLKKEPVGAELTHDADPIEVVFPLGPSTDPGLIQPQPALVELEPEPTLVEAELEPAAQVEAAQAEPEPVLIDRQPTAPEPDARRPEPEPLPDEPLERPAVRLVETPRFYHLFDEDQERSAPTIRPLAPPIGAATASIPATWARPRFLSQSFSLDDDSNDRRTRPTPVVTRTTAPAPPVPLREHPRPTEDESRGSGAGGSPAGQAEESDDSDETEDSRSRKSRRRQKRR